MNVPLPMKNRRFAGTLAMCALLLMGSSATTLSADSSEAQGSEDTCSSMLVGVILQAGLDVETSAPAFGCRQNDMRAWYMPNISVTSDRVIAQQLTPEGVRLLEAVDRMSTDVAFSNSLQFVRAESTVLVPGPGGVVNSTDLSDNAIGAGPQWLNNVRDRYSQSMMVYLTRTAGQEAELVSYIEWFMARRDVTLAAMTGQMNPMAANGFLSAFGYQQFPWPWQLADPAAIAAYAEQNPTALTPDNLQLPTVSGETSGTLALSPTEIRAHPGETVTVELVYPRLQGVHSVAFAASAESMTINNIPMFLVDLEGEVACSAGSSGDVIPPIERAISLQQQPDVIPAYLELTIGGDAQFGDQLAVCVEMIGFAGDKELFSWNSQTLIEIAE